MEVDALELKEKAEEAARSRLNSAVAIMIALLATFMGICKVKDKNIVLKMEIAQTNKLDDWGYYQAKNTQSKLMSATAAQMEVLSLTASGSAKATAASQASFYRSEAKRLDRDKNEQKKNAEAAAKEYEIEKAHDDQFDLSDALLAIAVALLAVTSLTQKRWLFGLALVPTAFGLFMGIAGLFNWNIHPEWIIRLIG